jgi:large subunit ribosomal protein L29
MAEKKNKLREMPVEDLRKQLNASREELMHLRFQQATGELTDFTRVKFTRRQIARLMTILAQRESEAKMGGK